MKDHLGNVIMQIIGFRRKCLSWTLSYKKTNTGKCSFITTSPWLQGALRAPSQHGGEHQGQGWRVSGTAPSTGFCALIMSAEGYLGAEKDASPPLFCCFRARHSMTAGSWYIMHMLTLPFLDAEQSVWAEGMRLSPLFNPGSSGPLWYCSSLISF